MELALTGRFVDAEFLHRWGVVNQLAEQGERSTAPSNSPSRCW